jgi:CBS domain containing-hemolysin-like protein
MEVAVQYGKLMKKPSWIRLDAEITLMGSFIVASGLIGYLLALISNVVPLSLDSFLVTAVSSFLISATLVVVGVGMVYLNKPHNLKSILWLPFIYFYWMLQTFIAAFAFFKFVFRRPKKWIKTHKTGKQTESFTL